jgi:hypothetical protein
MLNRTDTTAGEKFGAGERSDYGIADVLGVGKGRLKAQAISYALQ